jgi:HlyB family type I secretion system ABC transporter
MARDPDAADGRRGRPRSVKPVPAAPDPASAEAFEERARAASDAAQRVQAELQAEAAARASAQAAVDEPPRTEGGADAQRPPANDAAPAAKPQIDMLLRCLMRATQFFGRPVGESDIRAAVPSIDDRMTVESMRLAGQRLGYKIGAAGLNGQTVEHLPVPFIVTNAGATEARLVLDRTGGTYQVYDPEKPNLLELQAAEVLALGDGAVLLRPQSIVEQAENDWRQLIVTRIRAVMWELFTASAVVNIFALASALFTMVVYNRVVGQHATDTLTVLAVGMFTVYLFDAVLRVVRGYVAAHTGGRIDSLLGSSVLHHLLHLPFKHFENTSSGLIAERVRQLDTIRSFFTSQMPMTVVDLAFVVLLFLPALFIIDPLVGFVTVGAIPLFVGLSFAFHGTQRKLAQQNFMGNAARASALNETISNALTVKSLALENEIERRFDQRLGLSAWTTFRSQNLASVIGTIGNLLQQVVNLVIIVGGARLIIAGDMTMGELIAANMLCSRALAPIRSIVSAWKQVEEVRDAGRRLDEMMQQPTELKPGELGPGLPIKGDITFENISFRYGDEGPPVLDGVTLTVESGQVLGIMGPSGSGKSTLAKLLQGLYQPSGGRVLIDGTDVSHISPATLRRQIGVVPQEVQLFAGTVRENISMGIADKDPARVVAVAKFVGAHDFIQHLPKGYDTVLSERGGGLSAGQRQLLAVARALIRNPRVMVLDEATSALDIVTEERLIRNLKRAGRGRTIVLVSHRIPPIAIADRAALLIDGRIERTGPPAEVVAFARTRMADRASEQQAS